MTAHRDGGRGRVRSMAEFANLLIIVCLLVASAGTAAVAGNARDRSFGSEGVALVDLGGADRAVGGFLLESGRYLLVGHTKDGDDRVAP